MKRSFLIVLALALLSLNAGAKVYDALGFGIKPDGITLNTRSIQRAIDLISSRGGGVLEFPAGKYLSGSIFLKTGVEVRLLEGAVLLGSTNPYDYECVGTDYGFILSKDQKDIAVTGKGTIDGQGFALATNFVIQVHMGVREDALRHDRTSRRPKLFYLRECDRILIDGVKLKDAGEWTLVCDQCEHLTISGIDMDSKNYWNNDGIDIVDCRHVLIKDSHIDASDDALCLKSHSKDHLCEDIEIRNCRARSSASAIKFGTVSRGGFKDIRIINNVVYDTYRSAITIASVDGAEIENILVDSLYATNTGNAIFLRTGERWHGGKTGYLRNVVLSNIHVEVPASKADAGYSYEGPIEDLPRNISPAGIVGIPEIPIENVTLRNVEIVYPGGGDSGYAFRGTTPEELESVPEMKDYYPEFSQFKELPAWGLYIRHAKGITLEGVRLVAAMEDYRPAVVADDVYKLKIKDISIVEPNNGKKKEIIKYKTK